MPVVAQGGNLTLDAYFKNTLGEPVNTTDVTLTLTDMFSAVIFSVTPPAITNPDIGHFVYDWSCPSNLPAADYIATWTGVFAGETLVGEDKVIVVPPGYIATAPLTFMVKPDDYDSVRGLLGVTTLDVEDDNIELSSFGQQAEFLIKEKASFWNTQLNDPMLFFPLRMAAIYKTAELMAESWVHGGTIGFVRPLGTGEGRDWAAAALDFENGYRYWMGIVDANNPAPDDNAGIWSFAHPVAIGGPTRKRLRYMRARGWYTLDAALDPYAPATWGFPPFWPLVH